MKSSELIRLGNIRKVYKLGGESFEALKGVDLTINTGEFVAIMGPSGSGKSTLMNILGALDRPTSGKYILKDTSVGDLTERQLADFRNSEVGFVFQQFNLLARTSVFDNVALPGVYGQIANLEERVAAVLKAVGLSEKAQNMSNQLSGGQIQRVAIARALLMQPAIIMADEPTGNLDSKTAYEIMKLFTELHNQGNTIILITHEPDIAEYAERIITIRDGLIQEDRPKGIDKTKQIDRTKGWKG